MPIKPSQTPPNTPSPMGGGHVGAHERAPASSVPNVFTIEPHDNFADAVARGVLARCASLGIPFSDTQARGGAGPRPHDGSANHPFLLSDITLLLPNKRSLKTMSDAFLRALDGQACLLPRLRAIGDLDDTDVSAALLADPENDVARASGAPLAPAIDPLLRRALLMRQVAVWGGAQAERISAAQSWRLAVSLEQFLEDVETAGLSFDVLHTRLTDLVPDNMARHWAHTLSFLSLVSEIWPRLLDAYSALDPAQRRDILLRGLARAWASVPPKGPVLAAGSTGSIPATAELLRVVARMPSVSGFPSGVILPGLHADMDDASWQALDPTHPQHAMRSLLDTIGASRHEVRVWHSLAPTTLPVRAQAPHRRTAWVRDALRPAETTSDWVYLPYSSEDTLMNGLEMVAASNRREEAGVIALAMREVLEVPGKTCALVTPDRHLARLVRTSLARWNIDVDDTAGDPLHKSESGRFMQLVLAVLESDFGPVELISLMQHPLCAAGYRRPQFIAFTRRLDRMLRGTRPGLGAEGVLARMQQLLKDKPAATAPSALAENESGTHAENAANIAAAKTPAHSHTNTPDNASDTARESAAQDADMLAKFLAVFDPLSAALQGEAQPITQLIEAHILVAEALAATDTLAGADRLWARDDGRALAAHTQALLASEGFSFEILPSDYPDFWREALEGQSVRPVWRKHPRLYIWGPIEARLQSADKLILSGLSEGIWPRDVGEDPFMSATMRAKLGLPDEARRTGQSAHDFIQSFSAPEVLLTRAEKIDGSPAVASRWLFRLEALAGRKIPQAQRYLDWVRQLTAPDVSTPVLPPRPTPPVSARPKVLSVTQIEAWMRDPYGLYASKILDLRKWEQLDAPPTAADKGTLIHEALERFLKEDGPVLGQPGLERLLAIGARVFEGVLTQPAVYAFWWPRFQEVARWFVANEAERRPAHQPAGLEVRGKLPLSEIGGASDFTLIAKADRIDVRKMEDGSVHAEIIDYKTGTPPTKPQLEGGYAPQLPLEAVMLQAGAFEGVSPAADVQAAFWQLKGARSEVAKITAVANLETLANDAREGLKRLVATFMNEEVPYLSQPRPAYTGYGDYDHLARVGEWDVLEGPLGAPSHAGHSLETLETGTHHQAAPQAKAAEDEPASTQTPNGEGAL